MADALTTISPTGPTDGLFDDIAMPTGVAPASPAEATPAPDSADDFFEDIKGPSRSAGEQALAAGQGAVGGLVETAPMVAGALAGGKLGAAAGALGGPFAPITVPVGGILGTLAGGAAGYFAGQEIRKQMAVVKIPGTGENFTFESMEAVPPDLRPYAVAGEVFGASLPFIGAPYLARAGGIKFSPHLVGRFFNRVIDTAVQYPKSFVAAELSSAIGSAAGGGLAEKAYPGQLGPRIAGEVAGGFFTPTRWAITGTRAAINAVRGISTTFSAASREGRAAGIIQNIVRQAGEDPLQVAARIRQAKEQFPDLDLTSAQWADSPALMALEAELVRESAKFGGEAKTSAEAGLGTLRTMIGVLERSGDPSALKQAAQMRSDYFQMILARRMQVAEDRALAAASEIDPTNAASTTAYGRAVDEIMDEAISAARKTERELWRRVGRDREIGPENLLARYESLRSERLPEEPFPSVAAGFINRIKKSLGREVDITEEFGGKIIGPFGQEVEQIKPITSGELLRFRSRSLELAREAASKGEWSNARIYGELAEATLDDLATLDDPAIDAARAWSRHLHDTFTRTFAGETQEVGKKGAARIPPEIIMKRALTGGVETGALHFRQLEEASRLAGTEYVSRMLHLQEQTIRYVAAKTIDPLSGRVNPGRLARFIRDNDELLERFPEIRAQLDTAETAEMLLRRTVNQTTRARRSIEQGAAFSRVLDGEDPALAVERALTSNQSERDFGQLVKLASRGGPEAKEGLASSIYSYAYNKSLSRSGDFSFTVYRRVFDDQIGLTGKNLMDLMVSNGIAKPETVKKLREVLSRAAHIEETIKSRQLIEPLLADEDILFDAVVRLAGAGIAKFLPTGGAHPLIVAGIGSRTARQVFEKIPSGKIKDVIIEAARNPEFMATLLQKAKTPKERMKLGLQLNAFLYQMGATVRPTDQPEGTQPVDEYFE